MLYGTHDPLNIENPRLEWVCIARAIGHDPDNYAGDDYTQYPQKVIFRAQNGWNGGGCIPLRAYYSDFARRLQNYILASPGIEYLIIGNEFQFHVEWPKNVPISPEDVAQCFVECYHKVKEVRPDIKISPGAIAPWNIDFENMDWLEYQLLMLNKIISLGVTPDFLTVHTYTHGQDPELVTSDAKMNAPYEERFYNFRAFEQFLDFLPDTMSNLPVCITETDQDKSWDEDNRGWVRAAYAFIHNWNQTHTQQVYCLLLYRASNADKYELNSAVIEDLQLAMQYGYEHKESSDMEIFYSSSFEEEFYQAVDPYTGEVAGQLTCPKNWKPLYMEVGKRPEWSLKSKVLGHPEVRTGEQAANFYSRFDKMQACLYQKFNVTPGTEYRVTVWGMGKASVPGFGMVLRADPNGGVDFEKAGLPESDWWSNYENLNYDGVWTKLVVEGVVGENGELSVFLVGHTDIGMELGATHWDDVMVEVGEVVPDPPPSGNGLAGYLVEIQSGITDTQNALDRLTAYIETNVHKCILVD